MCGYACSLLVVGCGLFVVLVVLVSAAAVVAAFGGWVGGRVSLLACCWPLCIYIHLSIYLSLYLLAVHVPIWQSQQFDTLKLREPRQLT